MAFDYEIYTDGGCERNPGGRGGFGVVMIEVETGLILEKKCGYRSTTNNRMEIMGVLEALKAVPAGASAIIHSDSEYVVNTLLGRFSVSANRDLWDQVFREKCGKNIFFKWVRGHSGIALNERCDVLATEAMQGTLIVDTGYEMQNPGSKPSQKKGPEGAPSGAMSAVISIPESARQEVLRFREDISIPEYSREFRVTQQCAKAIKTFYAHKGSCRFKDYMNLRVYGFDWWSDQRLPALAEEAGDDTIQIIGQYFSDEQDISACARWYNRGLRLSDAIRKRYVEKEVAYNAIKH